MLFTVRAAARSPFPAIVLAMALPGLVFGAGLPGLEKTVQDFQLPNGLRVVVAERNGVPVAAVLVHVKAGVAEEPRGKAGLARLFERLITHGSREIGTLDWPREKAAIAEAEAAWRRVETASRGVPPIDPADLQRLEVFAKMAQESALAAARPDYVLHLWDRNGIRGLFDATADSITYLFTMPSNRVEVCLKVVGAFLREPVFRHLRKDLAAEREKAARLSVNPDPSVRSLQLLARAAFTGGAYARFADPANPNEILGEDVDTFFRTWFTPNNIVVAVTGQVPAPDLRRMADLHLSNLGGSPSSPAPSRPPPEAGPAQTSETRVREAAITAPMVSIGFRRPEGAHPDDAALQVAYALLFDDQEGMVSQELTIRNLASRAQAQANFPGRLRPHLLAVTATAARAGQEGETETAILDVVERLREAPLPEETVIAARAKLRMTRLRTMESPGGLARELARSHAEEGEFGSALSRDCARWNGLPPPTFIASLAIPGQRGTRGCAPGNSHAKRSMSMVLPRGVFRFCCSRRPAPPC